MLGDSNDYVYFEEPNQGVLKLFKKVGSNKKVLDVGCGYGNLGEILKKQNNYVIGLDINQYAVEKAKNRIDEAYCCNIIQQEDFAFLKKEDFDLIIFADVLEHLYDPWAILKKFSQYLKSGGYLIVSLPNITAWLIRLKLLFGKFDYQETGILDKTHIRFFNKKNAKKLIQSCDFEIEQMQLTPFFVRAFLPIVRKLFIKSVDLSAVATGAKADKKTDPRAIIDSNVYKFYIKYFYPIETFIAKINSNLFAFQFVFYARKK